MPTSSSVRSVRSASGRVNCAASMATSSGSMYWSQIMAKPKMPMTPSAGRHSGSTTDQKIRSSPAPSIRAASSSSSGISFMNSVITRIEKRPRADRHDHAGEGADEVDVDDGTSASTSDSGIASTSSGSIIVPRISSITSVEPGTSCGPARTPPRC